MVDLIADLINETLENQRYGRNKETLIDKTYIKSGEYRRKFDEISDNPEVTRIIYNAAKIALYHRSGTLFEDMYWFDSRTGEIVLRETESAEEKRIISTPKIEKFLRNCDTSKLITLHTHPNSFPPSVADFNSAFEHGYGVCYIATHDGKLFGYTSREEINERLYDAYMREYINNHYSDYEAQKMAIQELMKNHKINFWEVG